MPYNYDCASNDVWSLGVILVNLTCGRNPWKQASDRDATYRAFLEDPDFLKTILPITDELNDILKKVFERDPARRITIPQLALELSSCSKLTQDATPMEPLSPDGEDFHGPGSPVADDSDSDSESSGSYSPPEPSSRTGSPDSFFSHPGLHCGPSSTLVDDFVFVPSSPESYLPSSPEFYLPSPRHTPEPRPW